MISVLRGAWYITHWIPSDLHYVNEFILRPFFSAAFPQEHNPIIKQGLPVIMFISRFFFNTIGKVIFSLCVYKNHTIKKYGRNVDRAACNLHLRIRWRWVVDRSSPWWKSLQYPLDRRLDGGHWNREKPLSLATSNFVTYLPVYVS